MSLTRRCAHARAVSVESDGGLVAALCPDCDRQLPAEWLTCDHGNTIELPMLDVRPPYEQLCNDCGTAFWPEDPGYREKVATMTTTGPTCDRCGGPLTIAGTKGGEVEEVCTSCQPDHPISVFLREADGAPS